MLGYFCVGCGLQLPGYPPLGLCLCLRCRSRPQRVAKEAVLVRWNHVRTRVRHRCEVRKRKKLWLSQSEARIERYQSEGLTELVAVCQYQQRYYQRLIGTEECRIYDACADDVTQRTTLLWRGRIFYRPW